MSKFIYFISSLFLFTIALYILPCSSHNCIHDRVDVSRIPVTLTRSIKYQDVVAERVKESYEPLKIHFYVDVLEKHINRNTLYNIQIALQKIKTFIENTFQVRKRKKPFLLERLSCSHRWQVGINRGKCSEYHGRNEECLTRGLTYQIPARFLDKLEIYDFQDPKPRLGSQSGPGLQDSNFIAFLTSENTEFCLEQDVSSYGTYCRIDRNTNEPLAGIINLCPMYFDKIYLADYYYNVLLHELFHILGFSSSLFEKFLPCQKGIYCNVPRHVIQEDSDGIFRMMYPLVIENTQKHFNCNNSDFGGPMDSPKTENETDIQFYPSHWHPVLMHSSIMTPKISEYDKIFVDSITLAVFASTGWYRINFEHADRFTFGLGEGCNFGNNDSCNDSIYLCDPSLNGTGCDLENKAISRCTSLVPYHPCGIYRPFTIEECGSDIKKQFELDFYALGFEQKCFMFQTPETNEPHCLPVKCKSRKSYSILVNMTWYPCNFKELIIVDNTTIYCPEHFSYCANFLTEVSVFTTQDHFCLADTKFFIAIRMYISVPTFEILSEYQSFKNFKATTLRGIADKIQIPVNYIVNSSVTLFKQIYLDFSICPPSDLGPYKLTAILMKVQSFLDSGSFLQVLKGPKDRIISSNDINIDPIDAIAFSDFDGFRTLLIFPAVCAIFLIATFIASIIRLFLIQRHRPLRSLGQLGSDIHLSEVTTPV